MFLQDQRLSNINKLNYFLHNPLMPSTQICFTEQDYEPLSLYLVTFTIAYASFFCSISFESFYR
jgi:hypothetical protein